jgi:hypothetical protein
MVGRPRGWLVLLARPERAYLGGSGKLSPGVRCVVSGRLVRAA